MPFQIGSVSLRGIMVFFKTDGAESDRFKAKCQSSTACKKIEHSDFQRIIGNQCFIESANVIKYRFLPGKLHQLKEYDKKLLAQPPYEKF
jgi:hypothetical protein